MDPWIWSVLLLLAGMAAVGLEVFVPSGGILAVIAGLCFLAAVGVAFMDSLQTGFMMIAVTAFAVPAAIALGIHWWPRTPIGRRILIRPPEHPDDVLPDTDQFRSLKLLVGRRGRSLNAMLPSGTVMIDRRSYDAASFGNPIEEDTAVEVVEVRMNRLIVRPCPETRSERESASTWPQDDILSQPIDTLGIDDPLR